MLWMILVGLLVGVMAKLLLPGRDPGGVVITILIGIGGSVVAGLLGRFVGWYGDGASAGFIASVLGAIVLLLVYRALTGRGRSGKADVTRTA
jgi:uncharacterized membrane protein YeaQ/YmgE (transglycosylase-associated protein family)